MSRGIRRRMNPATKAFAKELRQRRTDPEVMLWQKLRNKQLGARFRQQAPLLGYIADFYCPRHKLVVEVDGRFHDVEKDALRDRNLARCGFRTLRIPARIVYRDIGLALALVQAALK